MAMSSLTNILGFSVRFFSARDHPRTIPAKFALIWFSGFRGEDLNVIFYQNMPNLHNRYKSENFTEKNGIYVKLRLAT
jgi:hypothetical protein